MTQSSPPENAGQGYQLRVTLGPGLTADVIIGEIRKAERSGNQIVQALVDNREAYGIGDVTAIRGTTPAGNALLVPTTDERTAGLLRDTPGVANVEMLVLSEAQRLAEAHIARRDAHREQQPLGVLPQAPGPYPTYKFG
ncbi:MAG: hypothetical protein AB7H77_08160 [Bdellovibrionales bacterium]